MSIPIGYRFNPLVEELINNFLKRKILGQELPCNKIKDSQVYGPSSNPWEVFDPSDDHSWLDNPQGEKFMYVFAKLSKLSNSGTGKNTSRKTGCGTWVCKGKPKEIKDHSGNIIGEERYLTFEINDIAGVEVDLSKIGFYSMHEYRLCGVDEGFDSTDTIVLCKITFEASKKTEVKLKSRSSKKIPVSKKTPVKLKSRSSSEARKKEALMNSGVVDNLEGTGVTVIDSGVGGDWSAQYNTGFQELDEFGGDLCFDDLFGGDNLEGSGVVGDNLEGSGGVVIGDNRELAAEKLTVIDRGDLTVIDSGVGDWFAAPPQYNSGVQELDEFGGGLCLDDLGCGDLSFIDWLMDYPVDSSQEEEPVEDNTIKLGKRKFEAENSHPTKKMCL